MANIKKSFNFRNGVQVDDDNFIVNPNGLVGIGSTIPTESLDVLGNVRVRGSLLVDSIEADSIVNTSETGSVSFNLVNVGITSITSGIVSATSGIVTYYGDGSNLQGLPTSQWVDIDPDINGYESIYAQGSVGIATNNPLYTFQVGGTTDINSFGNGVGIASEGDVRATRDINIGRNLNITGITTVGSNLYVSGFTTVGSNLYVSGFTTVGSNLYVSGIITASSFNGFGTNISAINATNISSGTLNNDRLPSNINKPSGITTFSAFYGNLVGIATTARNLTTDANIDIVSIVSDHSNLGIATASTFNATTSIGIGTNNANSDLHVRRVGSDAEIQITSDTNTAKLVIGQDVTIESNNTVIQFNDASASPHPQSGENCFDIINYAPGNFNSFIRPESTPNLKFNWINYSTNKILMSLTPDGNLGVGKTNPTETFEVVGTSTVTSDSFIGGDFSVSGEIIANTTLTVAENVTVNGKLGIKESSPVFDFQVGSDIELNGDGIGVGINTNGNVIISGIITANKFIGIGSDITSINPLNITSGTITNVSLNSPSGVVTANKFIGIGSDITSINPLNITSGTITNVSLNSPSGVVTANKFIGIGSDITSINPLNITSGTITNVSLNSPLGVVTAGIISVTGSNSYNSFWGRGSNITEINPVNINSGNFSGSFTFGTEGSSISISTTTTGFDEFDQLTVFKTGIRSGISTLDISVGIGSTVFLNEYTKRIKNLKYDIFVENIDGSIQSESISIISNGTSAFSTSFGFVANPSRILTFSSKFIYIGVEESYITLDCTPDSGVSGLTTIRYTRYKIES